MYLKTWKWRPNAPHHLRRASYFAGITYRGLTVLHGLHIYRWKGCSRGKKNHNPFQTFTFDHRERDNISCHQPAPLLEQSTVDRNYTCDWGACFLQNSWLYGESLAMHSCLELFCWIFGKFGRDGRNSPILPPCLLVSYTEGLSENGKYCSLLCFSSSNPWTAAGLCDNFLRNEKTNKYVI